MPNVPCPTCHGAGVLNVEDPEAPCTGEITVGNEEPFTCYATRKHPGWPHMAILCEPCAACGGFEEHDPTCAVYPATDVRPERVYVSTWWFWNDGDLTVTRDLARLGQAWRDEFQPTSPWARKNVA